MSRHDLRGNSHFFSLDPTFCQSSAGQADVAHSGSATSIVLTSFKRWCRERMQQMSLTPVLDPTEECAVEIMSNL
jgi:hypothetical protein